MGASESAADQREGAFTRRLRRIDPVWWWLRENFRLPSLGAIGGVLAVAAVWIWDQHLDLSQLKNREDPKPHLERIEAQLSEVLQVQSAMKQQLADFSRRIDDHDRKWERVEEAAEIRIPHRHTLSR